MQMAAYKPEMFVRKESLQKEKQISVDPISLTALHPPKSKFLHASLPSSASSSPRSASKKNGRKNTQPSGLSRQRSVALLNLELLRERHQFRRSKSCGEGRSSSPSATDLDLWVGERNTATNDQSKEEEKEERDSPINDPLDQKFKCGALCLFLPGFSGKAKPVRARKEETETTGHVVSRRVSMERFECGSWTSSAILNDGDDDGLGEYSTGSMFFDLPLELIRSGVDEANSPVRAAFVFDNKDRKGVLKSSSSSSRVNPIKCREELNRHVRFSTSSPTGSPSSSCATPRLRKARDDFNAFLEAQSA